MPAADGWDSPCEPAPGVRRLHLGGRAVLFCERGQQLFELNATADAIWQGLAAGRTPRAVAGELRGLGAPSCEANAFVATSAEAWLRDGLLAPIAVTERARGVPDRVLNLRLGGSACALGLFLGPGDPLPAELAGVFGQFAGAAARDDALQVAVVTHEGGYVLLVAGAPRGRFAPERIVPEIKAVLTEHLAAATGAGAFLLHAAVLTRRGRGLLLTGPPGAGKTTLAVALAARGLGYGADDIVLVSPRGGFAGVPFSPAAKAGAWDLLALPDDFPTHLRGDGQQVRYVPTAGFARGEAETLGWALALDRRPGASAELEPMPPLEMLTALLAAAFSPERALRADTLEAFAATLGDAQCHRLVYDDLPQAAALIEALVDG